MLEHHVVLLLLLHLINAISLCLTFILINDIMCILYHIGFHNVVLCYYKIGLLQFCPQQFRPHQFGHQNNLGINFAPSNFAPILK